MMLSAIFFGLACCMAFLRIAAAVQSVLTEGQNRLFGKHADSLILKLGIIFICSAAIVGLLESFSPNV